METEIAVIGNKVSLPLFDELVCVAFGLLDGKVRSFD